MVEPLREAKCAEKLLGPFAGLVRVPIADQLRQDHIFRSAELGQQMMKLIDEAQELASQPGAAVVVQLGRFLAVEPDRSLEPAFEQADRL